MRRVAFLSFDWDYEIVSEYYRGMQAYAHAHEGLQVVIFSAFGHYYVSYEPEEGSFAIFSLCDIKDYDGIVIQGNRTWPPAMRQRIVDEAVALGKPVVSINYELEGAYYVGTNNYEAMYGLVSRVLEDRGCTRPAFVNGLVTSVEAQDRTRAYRDACAARDIADARFFQANWQIEEGVATAQRMLQNPDDLPDVVFCCNDDLAVGLQETLQQAGVRVPEDVMVTGFDNREISLRTSPRVTTVDRDYFTIACTALSAVERVLDGEGVGHDVWSPVRYVLTESCAYHGAEESVGDLYSLDNSLKHFYEVLSNFQTSVLSADSLDGILLDCERYADEIRCPNVYLTINDGYLAFDTDQDARTYGTVSHLMAHSGPALKEPCDKRHIYASFLTEKILPPEVPMDRPVYVVCPLRHNETCIGTVVTEDVSPSMQHGFLTFFLTLLSGSIESVRKKELLMSANSRLDNLYVHDELTGLFNRFGLDRFGTIAYEHLLRDFDEAQFIFVDVDNMKLINDECGHEMGDRALRDTADILRRATIGENAFAMRYGGDEFLLICRRNLIPRIEAELALLHSSSKHPYELGLSMGLFCVRSEDHFTMAEAVRRADARMYEIKKAHRARR